MQLDNKENSLEARLFNDELNKAVKKLANKHGYKIPSFNSLEKDGVIFMNITAYSNPPENHYKNWYLKNASELGLENSWIGVSFNSSDGTKKLNLLGLDPDGGNKCIRVRDENGIDYHITPATLSHLIVNQI
jgi:hypothetical protein